MPNLQRMQRTITKLLLVLSIIYAITGLLLPRLGYTNLHMTTMLLAGLLLFPHSIALAYVASGTPRNRQHVLLAATLLSLPYLAAPLVAANHNLSTALALALPLAIAMIPASLIAAGARKGSTRMSLAMTAVSYTFLSLAVAETLVNPQDTITTALVLILSYPVPLIIAVTSHSLPATFHDEHHKLAPIPLLLTGIAGLTLTTHPKASLLLQATALILYTITARIYKTYTQYPKNIRPAKTPAQKGLHYFLTGHQLIPLTILFTLYALTNTTPLTILHTYTIGFILHHVIIHAPLMIPVILGIKHKRKYTTLPYIALLLALLTWPLQPTLSLILILFIILLIIKIVI